MCLEAETTLPVLKEKVVTATCWGEGLCLGGEESIVGTRWGLSCGVPPMSVAFLQGVLLCSQPGSAFYCSSWKVVSLADGLCTVESWGWRAYVPRAEELPGAQ